MRFKKLKNSNPLAGFIRPDIPGIFNEVFILKKYLDRFNHALNDGDILPPYEVIIHPSSQCNLRCEWCIGGNISGSNKIKEDLQRLTSTLANPSNMERLINNLLSYEEKRKIVKNGKKIKKIYKIENVSFSGITGEPLIAKESLIKAIRLLTQKNVRVGVYTNGTLLDNQLIDELLKVAYVNFSIDAGSAATYSRLKYQCNKDGEALFNKLIMNIKRLIKARNKSEKSNLQVNASYVLYPGNYREIYETAKFLKGIGIENFRVKQDNLGKNLLSKRQMNEASKILEKIDNLVDDKFKFIKIHRLNNPSDMDRVVDNCMITDLMAAVGSDGNVYPCNYHPRVGGFSYGNAIETKFQLIWEGEKRKKIRKSLPSICPEACDPFKNRANRLFEAIRKCQAKYGKEKTNVFISEIINYIK